MCISLSLPPFFPILLYYFQAHAQQAAKSVKVSYEILPAILTIEQAIEKKSFYITDRTIRKGDTEEGFKVIHI